MKFQANLCSKLKKIVILNTIFTILIFVINLTQHKSFYAGKGSDYAGYAKYAKATPGSYLRDVRPNNESYCNFGYNLPFSFAYSENEVSFTPELGAKSPYRVLYNVIHNDLKGVTFNFPPVTYATHATIPYIDYVTEIAKSWDGPVSLAVFVPDTDADIATKQLIKLCHCLPQFSLLSVHYVFPAKQPPVVGRIDPLPISSNSCFSPLPGGVVTFKEKFSTHYPVNVCRNVAKNASSTNFVMVSDIELMPSLKLAQKFLDMHEKYLSKKQGVSFPSEVFVVPVFEVESYEDVPTTKEELIKLIRDEKATYFHRFVCSHCQKFPGIEEWLNRNVGDQIKPFKVVRREFPHHRWEPIYIGKKNEPLYSEVLSWEGQQDKMTQMLTLCLIGYRFIILDGCFLVHWPGIKRKSQPVTRERKHYLIQNSRQYDKIVKNLTNFYKNDPSCIGS